MGEHIAKEIALALMALPYFTKGAGLVQALKVPVSGYPTGKVIPAVRVYYTQGGSPTYCSSGEYMDMLPNSAETGIFYLEDQGATRVNKASRFEWYRGKLKLVAWFNAKLIGDKPRHEIIMQMMEAIPGAAGEVTGMVANRIKLAGVPPATASDFAKYTLDELQQQYITHPYWHLCLQVDYTAMLMPGCSIAPSLNPAPC
jgi:hypothetical protein